MLTKIQTLLIAVMLLPLGGCTVVSANRTFPKLAWYWSADAKLQRQENALESAKIDLWGQLSARDSQIVDLIGLGKRLVDKHGGAVAWDAVLETWKEQTGSAPTTKAGDVIWLQDQSPRVRDLAWLIHYRGEWML